MNIQIWQSVTEKLPGAQLYNANDQNQKYWNRFTVAQKQKIKMLIAEAGCLPHVLTADS